jgi:hypothetical protein
VVGWLVGWSVGQLAGWLFGCLTDSVLALLNHILKLSIHETNKKNQMADVKQHTLKLTQSLNQRWTL